MGHHQPIPESSPFYTSTQSVDSLLSYCLGAQLGDGREHTRQLGGLGQSSHLPKDYKGRKDVLTKPRGPAELGHRDYTCILILWLSS